MVHLLVQEFAKRFSNPWLISATRTCAFFSCLAGTPPVRLAWSSGLHLGYEKSLWALIPHLMSSALILFSSGCYGWLWMCVLNDWHYPLERFFSSFKTLFCRCENPVSVFMAKPILFRVVFLSTATLQVPQGEEIVSAAEMCLNGQKLSCRPTSQ